jgi:nicotinate-nucleotide pyrophosphorylase (carboxylating)
VFSPSEKLACRRLIELALEEDLGTEGDLTSQLIIPATLRGSAKIVCRSLGVISGLPAVELVFRAIDSAFVVEPMLQDGVSIENPNTVLARISGPMQALLTGERTALNFLQRLSGVATLTRRYVDAVAGLPVKILDTRKTTPGWRLLEKYAVRCGGGHNHRIGLYDGVLIKDNHLAALDSGLASIRKAIDQARSRVPTSVPIEIEVESQEQLYMALSCRPNIVLLDNMNDQQLRDAVRVRNEMAPEVELEASGGVTLETVRGIAETGVDRISIGALTHSAPALDIALDYSELQIAK